MRGNSRDRFGRRTLIVAGLLGGLLALDRMAPLRATTGGADADFGDLGRIELDLDNGLDVPGPAHALPDGSMLVATSGAHDEDHPVVRRVLADGRPDPTFGDATGRARSPVPGRVRSLAPGPLGSIVFGLVDAAGVRIVRLLPSGPADPSFGTGGVVRFDGDETASSAALAVDALGRVTVVTDRDADVVVRRLLPNGALDPTFGLDGVRRLSFADDCPFDDPDGHGADLVVQADGGLLVGANPGNDCQPGGVVIRLLTLGLIDPLYGATGTAGLGWLPGVQAMAAHGDGLVVLHPSGLARVRADGTSDPGFGPVGLGTTGTGYDVAVAGDRIYLAGERHSYAAGPSEPAHQLLLGVDAAGNRLPGFPEGGLAIDHLPLRDETARTLLLRPQVSPETLGPVVLVGAAADQSLLTATRWDGSPAVGFGDDGHTLTGVLGGGDDDLTAVEVDGLGRTVVAGTASWPGPAHTTTPPVPLRSQPSGTIARLLPDGSLDPSFGQGGRHHFAEAAVGPSIVVLPTGGVVAAAPVDHREPRLAPGTVAGVVLTRLDPDGVADPTFGDGGLLHLTDADLAPDDPVHLTSDGWEVSLALGPQETLVLVGLRHESNVENTARVLRLRSDGSPDPTFNGGAPLAIDLDALAEQQVLADGSISVIGGRADGQLNSTGATTLARITPVGALDPAVGVGGYAVLGPGLPVPTDPPPFFVRRFAVRSDGQIVASVTGRLVRFDRSGGLLLDVGAPIDEQVAAVTILDDGTVLVASHSTVWRFHADLTVDTSFGVGGRIASPIFRIGALDVLSTTIAPGPGGAVTIAGNIRRHRSGPLDTEDSDIVVERVDLSDPTSFPEVSIGNGPPATVDENEFATVRFPIALSRPTPFDVEVVVGFRIDGMTVGNAHGVIPARATDGSVDVVLTRWLPPGTYTLVAQIGGTRRGSSYSRQGDVARVVGGPGTATVVSEAVTTPPPPSSTTTLPPAPTTSTTTPPAGPAGPLVLRLAGPDRVATSVAIAQAGFPAPRSAAAAVLARSDDAVDALAGTPLAVDRNGPLLVTGSTSLDPRVGDELVRALPPGAIVYLLGGAQALGPAVEQAVRAAGFSVARVAGADRYQTSIAIASAMGQPAVVVLTTGQGVADALSAGTAAAVFGGAVVLTEGDRLPPATAAYLTSLGAVPQVAVGGPAAAAAPGAHAVVGADRYETSALVASTFFPAATVAAFANGRTPDPSRPTAAGFDALAGGVLAARFAGPLLLVEPGALPPSVARWVDGRRGALQVALLYGGTVAVSAAVEQDVRARLSD